MDIRHIAIARRMRYAIEPARAAAEEVWFGLHGYGQLGPRFMRYFQPLKDPARTIVTPEGLHRYYLDHAERKIGASWMTSEDRLTDIEDYVAYLDELHAEIGQSGLGGARPAGVRCVGLGFSQGVHTLARWLAFGASRLDRVVFWGAGLPPDLDLEAAANRFRSTDVVLVAGEEDEYFPETAREKQEERLSAAGVPFRRLRFSGGHRLDADVLRELAGD